MLTKKISAIVTLLIIIASLIALNQNESYAVTNNPSNLKIYVGPSSVLADGDSYNCIFIQLQDSSGKPARALQDITVSLSSSSTNVGTVQPLVTITKGATFASATFQSTFTPGITSIAATATGFATVQASMATIGAIPKTIALAGVPPTLPADGNSYNAIMVQLQDSTGLPAQAPKGGVQVTLTCSNTITVGSVTPLVTIPEGKTFALATFTTIQNNTKQTAVISSIAQGYLTSQQLTITTTPIATNPNQIKIFLGQPLKIPADESPYEQIVIELQNSAGYVSVSTSDTSINVASSDPTVGEIGSQITIPANQTYTIATLNTSYKSGTITISATASNLNRADQPITTVGFTPSKLAVFCSPSTLPSDNSIYNIIQVQLQDSQGRPARDPATDVSVNLFSSQPTVGIVQSTLTIPFGQTTALGNISVTNSPGSTSITAQASSYTTGQSSLTTYLVDFAPLEMTLTPASQTLNNTGKTAITAYLTANGGAVLDATIQFKSDNGGTFTTVTSQGNGYYKINFTAPSFTKTTTCTITATASATGYMSSQATTQIAVQPPNSLSNIPSDSNSTSNGTLTIQFHILDISGKPIISANVSSTTQPAGVRTLSAFSNTTGYVSFTNVTAGQYSFTIVKEGYQNANQTVNLKTQSISWPLQLSSINQAASNEAPLTIIIIAIISVIIAVIGVIVVVKRRKSKAEHYQL